MRAETIARGLALNRALIGTALALAPERTGGGWIGADSKRPGAQLMTRGLGARDIAVGLGTLMARRQGASLRPWALAALVSDAADLLATAAVADSLPRAGRLVGITMAGGSTLLGAWLSFELD